MATVQMQLHAIVNEISFEILFLFHFCNRNFLLLFFTADSTSNASIIIAKQNSFRFEYHQGLSIISYEYSNLRLNVFLICHIEHESSVTAFQDGHQTYNIYLQSQCCCPGICHYPTHTISSILIMIAIIIIFLVGYILASIIFLRRRLNFTIPCHYLWFDCSLCEQNRNANSDYENF